MVVPKIHGLYAITDGRSSGAQLAAQVEAVLRGGATVVQYRDKSAAEKRRRNDAATLRRLCRDAGATFIINDDVALALDVGADGVHIGSDDMPFAEARERTRGRLMLGVSCYNRLEDALAAQTGGADYVAFGGFFPSATKPGAVPADIALLRRARTRLRLPMVAIGGINAANGAALLEAGADALAVVRALFGAADVESAARDFLAQCFAAPTARALGA